MVLRSYLFVKCRWWQDSRTCGFQIIVNNAEGDPQLIILGTHDVDVMDIEGKAILVAGICEAHVGLTSSSGSSRRPFASGSACTSPSLIGLVKYHYANNP